MVPDPLADLARLEGVPSAVAAARDAVDLGARRRRLRPLSDAELVAARRAGAEASAALTGAAERWRAGCWALAVDLDELAASILTAPLQAIARAHVLVVSGELPDAERGRLRAGADVADRMQGVATLLTRPTAAPAIVLAAVVHAEIASVAPFGLADEIVARTVARAVLVATGLDPAGAVPVEAGHLRREVEYRRTLAAYGTGTVDGVRSWIVHCAEAVGDAVVDPEGA
jgi:hypothetical protein